MREPRFNGEVLDGQVAVTKNGRLEWRSITRYDSIDVYEFPGMSSRPQCWRPRFEISGNERVIETIGHGFIIVEEQEVNGRTIFNEGSHD